MSTITKNIYLSVENVDKRYGDVWANHTVSIEVHRGEICGLLGPNGAGKTTLLRLCAGWITPNNGNISIMGKPVTILERAFRRHIGIVSYDTPYYSELTVLETLRLYASLHDMHGACLKHAVKKIIDSYSLSPLLHTHIDTLSTGMRQRVAIACALLHSPSVLLMDEPTAGLDPSVRNEIWNHLRTAAHAGTAILLTTHYFEEAARLCNKIYLIVQGRIATTLCQDDKNISDTAALEKEYESACSTEAPYISHAL